MVTDPAQNDSAPTLIVLVHGVGLPSPNTFGTQITRILDEMQIGTYDLIPLDWHSNVEQPLRGRLVDLQHLRQLMRAFIGASARAASPNWIHSMLHVLFMFAPFAIGATVIALLMNAASPVLERSVAWFWAIAGLLAAATVAVGVLASPRHGLATTCRQLALTALWPCIFIGTPLFSVVGVILGAVVTIGGVLFAWARTSSGRWILAGDGLPIAGREMPEVLISQIFVVLVAWITYLLVAWFARRLRWPIKVLADVVRFMGDRDYFERLLAHGDTILGSVSFMNRRRVVVVGHSLGSAIAALLLVRYAERLPHSCWLHLVTMGSPWTRLLARFFADTWPRAGTLADHIAKGHRLFSWTNVYRPFDPIGGGIFAALETRWVDVSTRQYRILPHSAHLDYWDDVTVAAIIAGALARREIDVPAVPSGAGSYNEQRSWAAALALNTLDRRMTSSWLPATAASAAIASLLVTAMLASNAEPLDPRRVMLEALRDPGETTGWLYQFSEFSNTRADKGLGWAVVFTPEGGTPLVIQRHRPRFVTYSGGEKTHVWYDSPRRKVDAVRFRVRVVYARTRPDIHFLPALEDAPANLPVEASPTRRFAEIVMNWTVLFFLAGMTFYCIWPLYLGTGPPPLPPVIRTLARWVDEP